MNSSSLVYFVQNFLFFIKQVIKAYKVAEVNRALKTKWLQQFCSPQNSVTNVCLYQYCHGNALYQYLPRVLSHKRFLARRLICNVTRRHPMCRRRDFNSVAMENNRLASMIAVGTWFREYYCWLRILMLVEHLHSGRLIYQIVHLKNAFAKNWLINENLNL